MHFLVLGFLFAGDLFPSDAVHPPPQEVQQFLQAICPGHANPGHANDSGCSVCPPEMPPSLQTWVIRGIFEGHFLNATSQDVLVTGFGCEDHANLMSGAYLFTKNGPGWKKVLYKPSVGADDCKKLNGSDGRDRLVCAGSDMHQGVTDSFLYVFDPGKDPGKIPDNSLDLFFDVMDSLGSCATLPDGTVRSGVIKSVTFQPRIQVIARVGQATVPAKAMEACDSLHNKVTIRTVPRRYEFTFDGSKIVPARENPPSENMWTAVAPTTSYSVIR